MIWYKNSEVKEWYREKLILVSVKKVVLKYEPYCRVTNEVCKLSLLYCHLLLKHAQLTFWEMSEISLASESHLSALLLMAILSPSHTCQQPRSLPP